MTALTAWSYSRYECWSRCPLQFKHKFLAKLPEAPSPAMDRGNDIHKGIAAYIVGESACLPQDAMRHPSILGLIQEIKAVPAPDRDVEQQWGFSFDFKPVGWFGKETWFRSILDAGVQSDGGYYEAVDWKTGKRYANSNDDQVESQALAVMVRMPNSVLHVTTRLAYVDSGDHVFAEFPASHMQKLIDKWHGKVAPMFADTIYAARPNEKCRFCTWRRSGDTPKCAFG